MGVRWTLSVWLWWLWLKVTPESPAKHAIVDATVEALKGLRARTATAKDDR